MDCVMALMRSEDISPPEKLALIHSTGLLGFIPRVIESYAHSGDMRRNCNEKIHRDNGQNTPLRNLRRTKH
ncbi:hypothetical protein WG66_004105 [Moniliophthora roreri]|nr:hypothetical protein WG66_004105 [Moniliophthora roreri]